MKEGHRILVIGYFGYATNRLNGQTVKTRAIYQLIDELNFGKLDYYDTQDFKSNKISIFSMFAKICNSDSLIYIPAHNNLKYVFPIIYILSKLFSVNIDYFVVGGWLSDFIKFLPIHQRMLRHIKGIHVETKQHKSDLERNYGYANVDIFPNFRFFNFTPIVNKSQTLRLVFMARINNKKGLDWIFYLADYIKRNGLGSDISITFFGPINSEDYKYFMESVNKYAFTEYKGELQPEDIYGTLNQYDVMLLPTHYYTEGFPGSILDAYISGIPVIATKWRYANEFIDDGQCGFIIPFENGQDSLVEKVEFIRHNPKALAAMKASAQNKRNEFSSEVAAKYMQVILK
ncbi:MAG: glycosyltransferase [Candidatus Egerieousia sp.]